MDIFGVIFFVILQMSPCSCAQSSICSSPQYLKIGRRGIIQCFFQEDFYAVLWYTLEGYKKRESLIKIIDGVKSGNGYSSGDYDIVENGSLAIRNVTLQHDESFSVLNLESGSDDNPVVVEIKIIVTVIPPQAFPVVPQCPQRNETCFRLLDPRSEVSCLVRGAKPAVSLTWVIRTAQGDMNISTQMSLIQEGPYFTSNATTYDPFTYSSLLSLLVCKAQDPLGVLRNTEAAIFVESNETDFSSTKPIKKYIEKDSRLELTCTKAAVGLIIWRKSLQRNAVFDVLSVAALFDDNSMKTTYSDEYKLDNNGTLLILRTDVKHEGNYGCVFQTADNIEGTTLFEVYVYVPGYPVIDGCILNEYCELEATDEGIISCSVRGVRPVVHLEFEEISRSDSSSITFTDREVTTLNNGDTFDVFVSSKYHVNTDNIRSTEVLLSVACKMSEPSIKFLKATITVHLSITLDHAQPTDTQNVRDENYSWTVGAVIIPIPVVVVIIIARYYFLKGKQQTHREENVEQDFCIVSLNEHDLEGKRKMLIRQLKGKYEALYNTIQPIPYIRERQYCVNTVFVDSGIKYLASNEGKEGQGTWANLSSYNDILNKPCVKSSVRILEGDPGYGKSTMTLQFAYDWCKQIQSSPLCSVELFILLRLRQLGTVSSIARAIKQFNLPQDSTFTEADIKNVLSNTASTLIILDGYDEYPDKDDTLVEVNQIILKNIYQDLEVILTTRSSYLPKKYAAGTKRLRLTGFDDLAREAYFKKIVGSENDEAVANIKLQLQVNPVLLSLCQIPLFFVMFAHMANDSTESLSFSSVTSFFRHVISCFHNHMRNKLADKNVTQLPILETKHHKLDKIAFHGLSGNTQKIAWEKDYLCKQIDRDVYDLYTRLGILVEEEVLQIDNSPGTAVDNHIKIETRVSFYHKLFCEWYAAHFVCCKVKDLSASKVVAFLQNLDTCDVQYLYRFACGLSPTVGGKIINYLKGKDDCNKLTALCILEQEGKVDAVLDTVKYLCSLTVRLDGNNRQVFQSSTIQVLEIADSKEIPISVIFLQDCFDRINPSNEYIQLKSNLLIPVLTTLRVLVIHENKKKILEEETVRILHYSSKCITLDVLRFEYCILPRYISAEALSVLQTRDVKVSWYYGWSRHRLNYEAGTWERAFDGAIMTDSEYGNALKEIRLSGEDGQLEVLYLIK